MRKVTYSMAMSLDGYVMGVDGGIGWTTPDQEVFRLATEEVRGVGTHLLGRRLYEAMLFWETVDEGPTLEDGPLTWAGAAEDLRTFAELWKALPKVVFSTTLTSVQGNARLASGSLVQEIERLRAEPGEGDIALGGATLAAAAAALGLIDEYRARVCPVLIGGGVPFHPANGQRVDLDLVELRALKSGIVYQRHRVRR